MVGKTLDEIVQTVSLVMALLVSMPNQATPMEKGWAEVAAPFVKKHCLGCHQGPKAKGGGPIGQAGCLGKRGSRTGGSLG